MNRYYQIKLKNTDTSSLKNVDACLWKIAKLLQYVNIHKPQKYRCMAI